MGNDGPSREWLKKAAEAEDATNSVSVGGLAADLRILNPIEASPVEVSLIGGPLDGGTTTLFVMASVDASNKPVYVLPLSVTVIDETEGKPRANRYLNRGINGQAAAAATGHVRF